MKLISCTILLLVIISCNNAEKEYLDKDGFEVIAISNAKKTRKIGLSPYIDCINYIPLETGPNILIGGVKKVEIGPQYIYVLDRRNSNSLSAFDHQGNFYTRIGQAGKGPGEYCSAHDFCLLGHITKIYPTDGYLIIYDRSSGAGLFNSK